VSSPTAVGGVTVLEAGLDTTGGLGTLRYLPGTPPTLSWQDPQDTAPGPEQPLSAAAVYTLPSSSVASAGLQRWVALQVDPALLPPNAVEETLLVRLSERHCLAYTVRNIGLTETGGTAESGGRNDLFIYFAEAPADRLTQPGLFRVAHIPVIYHPSSGRQPSAPLLEVLDGEFATIGQ